MLYAVRHFGIEVLRGVFGAGRIYGKKLCGI